MKSLHLAFSRVLLTLLLWILPLIVLAHKPSDSYLSLNFRTEKVTGRWDIALRDLEYAIGIDANHDGNINWGELRSRHTVIAEYVLSHLKLENGGAPCYLEPTEQLVDRHSDGVYTVLHFTVQCPVTTDPLILDYSLFFDQDPTHRGLLRVDHPGGVQTAIFSPDRSHIELIPQLRGTWPQFADYWWEGVWHIWIGYDHLLFLLALLLPAVVWREDGRWRAVASLRPAVMHVISIVTAFTLAHSITLSAAVLGWIALPSRWVESAIAATVVLAAVNNLYPIIQGRRWLIAFCLGLIHGLGFAGVLAGLDLPNATLVLALAGFNLGVESGQLVFTLVLMPIALVLRDTRFYRLGLVKPGSVAVAAMASVWLPERSLGLTIISL
jgi:HupE / UreJ protein